ncbi:MAG TPA: T9SS type A sorting domain-containing protein [Flavobacterium sp.]|nr:T9SS type A sorting domain-containing protein [Flavobacterium sp.]
MKKLYTQSLYMLFLFVTATSFSQLFVGSGGSVFVNDRMVFVNQDVNLDTGGNVYLRNESQLLQGTAGGSANKGAGKLSVFQEGSVNNFAYNYWCSPVGNASASTGNENFGPIMLNRPTDVTNSTGAVLLGTGVFDGTATPLQIADRWIFTYLSNTTYAAWAPAGTATPNVPPGMGFTMKGSSGTDGVFSDHGQTNNPGSKQRYDFRGKPNDGNISVTVGPGQRTLTGNPYPSAIDLKAYLMAATGTTKVAYFWEQDPTTNSHLIASYKGGYGTYSPLAAGGVTDPTYGYMGVYVPPTFYAYDGAGTQLGSTGTGTAFQRRFCPIGQGFMIEGSAGGTVTMSNNFRVYVKEGTFSDFNRNTNHTSDANPGFLPEIQSVSGLDYTTVSTAEVPQIRFNTLLNNQGVKQTALVFVPGASDGAEIGMDAKSPDATDIDMYFVLDNSQYVISVIDFDVNKKIPVGFKANIPVSFRMTVAEMVNFDGAENVYLHDLQTDIYHDIKNAEYEFSLPAGTVNDRYEVTFRNDAALSVPELAADAFDVFQNNDSQLLTIANPKMMDIKTVNLYDISGKLIFNKTKLGVKGSYQFPTSGIADAVYIVKIMTADSQQYAKKITVYNGKK